MYLGGLKNIESDMKNQKRTEKLNMLLINLITSYLGQIHTTLLQIMMSVSKGDISASHNETVKELQETQKDIIKELKKYG